MKSIIHTIVLGGLNTDIVAVGVEKLLGSGEYTKGKELQISPGGKSRNIAQMIAALSSKGTVAMIGKTTQDPYGLWKLPLDALKDGGVNTKYVQIVKSKELPGVALIAVDKNGQNQIYVLPGISNSFFPNDIQKADGLFKSVATRNGNLVFSLEMPLNTAVAATKRANKLGIKVLVDPGGITEGVNYKPLLKQKLFLLKPNEHEASLLSGIKVKSINNAKRAAQKLLQYSITNVFITLGKYGGVFANKKNVLHIPIPKVKKSGKSNETGCGDQTMAGIAASLATGKDIFAAVKIGLLAGTLQFYKSGITPVTKNELKRAL